MSNIKFHGVMPALISPVNEDGTLRRAVVKPLVEYLLEAGCSGFYVCGATGEGVVMQPQARMEMVEAVVEAVSGHKLPDGSRPYVIDHIGAVDLMTAKKLAAHAASAGADAVSSVPPFFYNYGDNGMYDYYAALSDAAGIPLLMYACPLSGVPVTLEMVERLMTIPNMIGLKWTNPNYYTMWKICALNGGDINVINGPDETLICGLTMGAHAGIGSTYNIAPKSFVTIYDSFLRGDIETARQAQYKVNRLIVTMQKYGGIPAVKKILEFNGFDVGNCTYPLKRLTDSECAALKEDLKAIGYDHGVFTA